MYIVSGDGVLRSLDMSKKLIKKTVFTVKLLNSTCHVNLETNLWFSCKTLRLKIGIKNQLSSPYLDLSRLISSL